MSEDRAEAALRQIRALLTESADREGAYEPTPCLTEGDVCAWEDLYGVALPEQYRTFLTEIGDGGTMPGAYCDFVIEPLAKVWGRWTANEPFPVTAERARDRLQQLKAEGHPADGVLFPELQKHWDETDQPPGCLLFGHYPCSDALFLVTAGDLRGSVWCSVYGGTPETDRSGEPVEFLAWFAATLTDLTDGLPTDTAGA
jgi:hypothetical protein